MMAGLFKNELTCTIQDGLSNGYSWHIADQRHWRKAMEDRWEEVKILSCKKYAKSITVGNHSILALSKVHQPAAARSCIRRVCGSTISPMSNVLAEPSHNSNFNT